MRTGLLLLFQVVWLLTTACFAQPATASPTVQQNTEYDLVVIVSGTGERQADSADAPAGTPPLLHVEYADPDNIRAELWYLNEAGIQAATGSTFSLTYSNGSPTNSRHAAVTYRTVDQTTPIGDSDFNSTLSSDPIERSVTVSADSMAVAGAVSADSSSYSWGNGWSSAANAAQ